MKLRKANNFTAGDRKLITKEPVVNNIEFKVHKFTPRRKPKKDDVVIFPIFSEFGCETLCSVYCLPKVLQKFKGKYSVVAGWHGREYFYRHLVDEFWELPGEFMWLREYSRAFHHVSKNLLRVEKDFTDSGRVIDVSHLGNAAVFPRMDKCVHCGGGMMISAYQTCKQCKHVFPEPGFFSDVKNARKQAVWLPESKVEVDLPERAVGITARNRKTYGRNLSPIFYERLIYLLEDLGYNPVWLGESVTTLPCPFARIPDYTDVELEKTFALASKLEFTIQFWTASSRLAAMVGTPYILFESPDQIWGAQEGFRLNLLTRGKKKIVASHYKNCENDHNGTLELAEKVVREIENNNFEDVIGMVDDVKQVCRSRRENRERIGDG